MSISIWIAIISIIAFVWAVISLSRRKSPKADLEKSSSSIKSNPSRDSDPRISDKFFWIDNEFFYGTTKSSNGKYLAGASDRKNGCGLIDAETKKLLFKARVTRANNPHVTNNGVVIVESWLGEGLSGALVAFDKTGSQIWKKQFKANVGESEMTEDEKFVTIKTYRSNYEPHSNRLFFIRIIDGQVIWKSDDYGDLITEKGEYGISLEMVDGTKRIFKFDENWKLPLAYEKAVKEIEIEEQGGIFNVTFSEIKKAVKSNPPDIAKVKKLVLKLDKEEFDAKPNDLAKYFRIKGEISLEEGDRESTILFWDKAIELNPKVGIKNKLNALKKELESKDS